MIALPSPTPFAPRQSALSTLMRQTSLVDQGSLGALRNKREQEEHGGLLGTPSDPSIKVHLKVRIIEQSGELFARAN